MKLVVATAVAALLASAAFAQEQHSAEGQQDASWPMPQACAGDPAQTASVDTPADEATASDQEGQAYLEKYEAALAKMREQMPDDASGDPDVDFVRRVIPHHQGLVDLSQAYLGHGQDEATRKRAELFIVTQRGQIAELCNWLEKHRS